MIRFSIIATLLLSVVPAGALELSRRFFLKVGSAAGLDPSFPPRAFALTNEGENQNVNREEAREGLLRAINAGSSDGEILSHFNQLSLFDPSRGQGAIDPALGGSWRLLWTHDESPAPVQALRRALRQPVSTQLLGRDAEQSFGKGRVAQVICI